MKHPLVLVKRERDPSSDATKRSLPVARLEYTDLTPAVPQPAMMILGFAGVGFMTYRRKTAALAA
jgi:hypothetical protein